MKKKFIIKDASSKYYTGAWREYWTRDVDSAYTFESEDEIINKFNDKDEEGYSERLSNAEFPLEQITMYYE